MMQALHNELGISFLHVPASWREIILLTLLVSVTHVGLRARLPLVGALAVAAAGGVSFLVIGDFSILVALAGVGLVSAFIRVRDPGRSLAALPTAKEASIVVGGLLLYELGRLHSEGTYAAALGNAEWVVSLERLIGMQFEHHLQSALLAPDLARPALNFLYSFSFLPLVFGAMVWLYLYDLPNYRLLRNSIGISAALAIVMVYLFPVAPPRLVLDLGVIDTVVAAGREHGFANEYAAIPSLHVGWLAAAGYAVGRSAGDRAGMVTAIVLGSLMSLVVIATGNHFWFDCLLGLVIALGPAVAYVHREELVRRWTSLTAKAQTSMLILARSPKAWFSLIGLGSLLSYLIVGQIITPGFTDYWGYLLFQMAVTLALLLGGELVYAEQGGFSWQTHVIAVLCGYLDTLGTAGDLYANIDEYDKLTHFIGVAAVTSAAFDVLRAQSKRRGREWSANALLKWALMFGVATGVGWEAWEVIGDKVFNTSRIGGMWDTSNDLVMDTAGALTAGFLLWFSAQSATSLPRLFRETGPSKIDGGGGIGGGD